MYFLLSTVDINQTEHALPITVPQLKNSCGKFFANDVNKIPRDTINPPTTAVSRVDLFLQNNITAGEIARDTKKDVAAKHPENIKIINILFYFIL